MRINTPTTSVIPAKAGIQKSKMLICDCKPLDPGLRRDDGLCE